MEWEKMHFLTCEEVGTLALLTVDVRPERPADLQQPVVRVCGLRWILSGVAPRRHEVGTERRQPYPT